MSTQTPEEKTTVLTTTTTTTTTQNAVSDVIENNSECIEHVKTEMEKLKINEQQTQLIDLSLENNQQKRNTDNQSNNHGTKQDASKETIYATPLRKLDRPKAKVSTNHEPKPNNSDDGVAEDRHILNFLKDTSKLQKKLQRSGCGSGNNSSGDSDYAKANFSSLAQEQHFVNLVQQNVIGYSENVTHETDTRNNDDETAPKGEASHDTEADLKMVPLNGNNGEYLPKISDVFIKREWIIKLIALCLEQRLTKQTKLSSMALGDEAAKKPASSRIQQKTTSQHSGVFLLGSNGSGKTSICKRIINGSTGTQGMLNRKLLCCYFINTQNAECHSLSTFIRCIVMQILSHSTLLSTKDDADSANQSKNSNDISSDTVALDTTLMDTTSLLKPNEDVKDEPKASSSNENGKTSDEKSIKTQMVRQNSETNKSGAKSSNRDSTYDTYPPSQKTNDTKPAEQNQCFTPSKSKTTRGSSKIPVKIGNKSGSPSLMAKETPNTSPAKKSIETETKSIIQTTAEKIGPNEDNALCTSVEYENVESRKKTNEPKTDVNATTAEEKIDAPTENDQPQLPTKTKSCLQMIADEYFTILTQNPEIMDSLNADNIEKNPDECFKKAILYPFLELPNPKSALLFLVDSIDEHYINEEENVMSTLKGNTVNRSRTIAELLANNFHMIPKWLFLVCTAKRQSRHIVKKFNGFKKIALDDLRKSHVVKDVQE